MYMDAFRHWKGLHDKFMNSFQDYFTACITLEKAFSGPPESASDNTDLEDLLLLVDKELSNLSTGPPPIRNAMRCLSRLRNRSTKLVPISRLPPEIMSSIFLTARQAHKFCLSGVRDNEPPPDSSIDTIMNVSSYWRLTAIRTPQLWSHVDLFATGYWKNKSVARAQLWLERASNAPLVMHIQDTSVASRAHPSNADISDIIALLAPHVRQLQDLNVDLRTTDRHLARSILNCLLADPSAPSMLASLHICAKEHNGTSDLFDILPMSTSSSRLPPLPSLRLLKLSGTHIDWASGLYSGLTELDLHNLPKRVWPTTEQIAVVLSSSLGLRKLRLANLGIVRGQPYNLPGPIVLGELRELNLLKLSAGLLQLLPLISACPKLTCASITLKDSLGSGGAIRTFFNRSSVVRLHIKDLRSSENRRISPFLGVLPQLKCLALERASVSLKTVEALLASWPRLHTMYMLKCSFLSDFVPQGFNSSRNLRSLVMWDCRSEFHDDFDDFDDEEDEEDEDEFFDKSEEAMEGLASELESFIPDVELRWGWQENPVARWFVSR